MQKKRIKLKKKPFIVTIILLVIILMIIFAGYQIISRRIALNNLTLSLKENEINVYEHDYGKVEVQLSNEKFVKDLEYSIDNSDVMKVDNQGNYEALSAGTAHLIIEVRGSNKKVECDINVQPIKEIKDLKITNIPQYDLYPDMQFSLSLNFIPKDANQKSLVMTSSNPEIASVDNFGLVQTKSVGKVTITVSVKDTSIQKDVYLNIIDKPSQIKTIYFSQNADLKIESNNIFQLDFKKTSDKNKDFVFSSNDNSVVSITPDGVVNVKRPGCITISYGNDKKKKTCKLTAKCDNGMLTSEKLKISGIDQCRKLMIVAHPDDETLWGGAHLLDGAWYVVVLTNGYNQQRVKELNDALAISKTNFIILNYPDLTTEKKKDDWSQVTTGIEKDVQILLKYKNWEKVVTHNPSGEYGHIHHKITSRLVKKLAIKTGVYGKLYYFGKFYSNDGKFYNKPKIPSGLTPTYKGEYLEKKKKMVNAFTSQIGAINRFWEQMIPFEEWTKATQTK